MGLIYLCYVSVLVWFHTDEEIEAAYLKFRKRLLGIWWRDRIRNDTVRERTGLRPLGLIIKERRLRWLGHILRMEDNRISKQAVNWNINNVKKKLGRPCKNWQDPIRHDLKDIGFAWDEVEELASRRTERRHRVAQCVYDMGWTKVWGGFKLDVAECYDRFQMCLTDLFSSSSTLGWATKQGFAV